VPSTNTGTALALADRLDSLMGIFSIGQQPSGSRDPFALRRASLGVLRIMLERKLDLNLCDVLAYCNAQLNIGKNAKVSGKELEKQVLTYVLERFKSWYKDKGLPAEIFLSVAALALDNPLDIDARVSAVHKFTLLPEAASLAAANKRVSNILSKQLSDQTIPALTADLLKEEAEKQLATNLDKLEKLIAPMLANRDYYAVLESLADLKQPVDQFFEDVMVMTDDIELRHNRLALLDKLQKLFMNVADISLLAAVK
jgi:glycyl-tRNA synthetase beta chain